MTQTIDIGGSDRPFPTFSVGDRVIYRYKGVGETVGTVDGFAPDGKNTTAMLVDGDDHYGTVRVREDDYHQHADP